MYQSIPKLSICNSHISRNTPCLPRKTLNNLCFYFLLGITVALREIKDNAYAKLWEANKVYIYGNIQTVDSCLCANPEHLTFLKNFVQFPSYVGSLDGQMPHQLAVQKASNPSPTSHYSKIFPCIKRFIQM